MKRTIILALTLCVLMLTACGSGETAASKASSTNTPTVADVLNAENAKPEEKTGLIADQLPEASADDDVDLDLTQMNANMVYAEVNNIMVSPEDYVGKTVRMGGPCYSVYVDETKQTYYAVIIQDATACCSQGLEYVLADDSLYPKDDTEVVVTGTFETYEELGTLYCHLVDAMIARG